jgi:flagellar biosynthesis regulator FlbT
LLRNLAKLQFLLEEQVLLCKSDHCFIRRKKTKSKRKKTIDFFNDVDVVVKGLYDIQITTTKFCVARMYYMRGVFILKKNLHKQKLEKLLKNLVETLFCFLHYKIALNCKLQ